MINGNSVFSEISEQIKKYIKIISTDKKTSHATFLINPESRKIMINKTSFQKKIALIKEYIRKSIIEKGMFIFSISSPNNFDLGTEDFVIIINGA